MVDQVGYSFCTYSSFNLSAYLRTALEVVLLKDENSGGQAAGGDGGVVSRRQDRSTIIHIK